MHDCVLSFRLVDISSKISLKAVVMTPGSGNSHYDTIQDGSLIDDNSQQNNNYNTMHDHYDDQISDNDDTMFDWACTAGNESTQTQSSVFSDRRGLIVLSRRTVSQTICPWTLSAVQRRMH